MRIQRIAAQQGHAVPDTVGMARGPFPPELFRSPEVVVDFTERDDMSQEVLEGATAQNGFKPPKWYRCRFCHEAVNEFHIEVHYCQEPADVDNSAGS